MRKRRTPFGWTQRDPLHYRFPIQIGRASCRERVFRLV